MPLPTISAISMIEYASLCFTEPELMAQLTVSYDVTAINLRESLLLPQLLATLTRLSNSAQFRNHAYFRIIYDQPDFQQ